MRRLCHPHLLPKLGDHGGRSSWKMLRATDSGWLKGRSSVFQVWPRGYTKDFIAVEAARTRAEQTQARQNPSMERGGRCKVLLLAKDLLATDRFWERDSWFSWRVWSLVGQPGSHTHTFKSIWAAHAGHSEFVLKNEGSGRGTGAVGANMIKHSL